VVHILAWGVGERTFVRPRSNIVVYAISPALLFDFALIRSLLSCCLAFAYQYCAAQEGGRLRTEHTHFADEEKCVRGMLKDLAVLAARTEPWPLAILGA
jgi:hypothetical protein